MHYTMNDLQFVDAMERTPYHGFSRQGLFALFEMLQDLEEATGESIEFDPVAFRSQFAEYASLERLNQDFCFITYEDWTEILNSNEVAVFEDEVREAMERKGASFREFDGGIILDCDSF